MTEPVRKGSRGRARTRAAEVLFEAEQRSEDPMAVLRRRRDTDTRQLGAYTEEIVAGVILRRAELDEAISTWSRGWSIDRMPAMDRTILRLGAWELLFNDDVPDAVAVSEAVGLAREFSTDESPGFVNGLLGRLQQVKPTLTAGGIDAAALDAPVVAPAEPADGVQSADPSGRKDDTEDSSGA